MTKAKSNMYSDSVKQWNISKDYIAGFFDGEGSITIKVSNDKRRKHGVYLGGRIQIIQTNKEILEKIALFLGYGKVEKRIRRKKIHLPCWNLYFQNEEHCKDFIKRFKDLVYLKKEQLELLEEFYDERKKRKNGIMWNKNDYLILLGFAERMQILNSGKITENLKNVIEKVKRFNEEEYKEKYQEYVKKKIDNLIRHTKKRFGKIDQDS